MKRMIALMMAAALTLALTACGSSTETPAETAAAGETAATETTAAGDAAFTTVSEGELHMATNASFPPYEMVADDGSFTGIDVEIATAIADKLGLTLVVDDMDFGSVITSVQSGKEDMAMAGLTVTDERKENVDFTDSYATGVQVVIVPEDSDITSIDDLEGKLIGCQEGTTGYLYCSDTVENGGYGEENVTAFPNGANAVQALLTDKVDCVVIDSQPAQEYVKQNEGLKILETEFTVEDYAIGVSKDNTALRDAINNALNELIEDGTVQSIIDTYITAD